MPDQQECGTKGTPSPLSGVTVVDLTSFLSGPFCTQLLADLGARVIKVEPLEGDSSRSIPPHFIDGDSAYFLGNNRGKESIAVNLKAAGGLELVEGLIANADVVVENFRPGVCERLGLHVAELRRQHPGLIWASLSGFGQTGPWRDRPAYDMIVQALSGVMSLTGEVGRPAVRLGIPAGDLVAGLFTAVGVCAAIAGRGNHGGGTQVDVSMLDCQLAMLSYQAVYSMIDGRIPEPQGARHDSIPTYRSFVGGDAREFVVTANTDRMWRELCFAIDRSDLIDDTRFSGQAERLANRDDLWAILEDAFHARPADEWVAVLQERRVPAALIKLVPEALADARVTGRYMVFELASASGGHVSVLGNPIKFGDNAPLAATFPPRLGADTDRILGSELGLDADTVDALRVRGVIG